MPQNITDVDAFTSPVAAPADGDTRNASSVLTPFQTLANRTRYLYNLITNGVPRIRYFDDLANLTNVTGQIEGDVAVSFDDTYLGFHIYIAAATGPQIYPWSIKPNGFADGDPGRWRHLFYTYGVTNATVGNNKWLFNSPGRVVEALEAVVTSPSSASFASSASWQDIGLSITKTLAIGDVVQLHGMTTWVPDSDEDVSFRIRVENTSGSATLDGGPVVVDPINTAKRNQVSVTGTWTATEALSHTFKMQMLADAGGPFNVTLYAQRRLSGLWVRP